MEKKGERGCNLPKLLQFSREMLSGEWEDVKRKEGRKEGRREEIYSRCIDCKSIKHLCQGY